MRQNGVSRAGYTKQLVLSLEGEEMRLTVETKVVKAVLMGVFGGAIESRGWKGEIDQV